MPRTRASPPRRRGRGKRILFINQYYWPDHASTAQHLTDLAESLAARGYECHVLCAQGRYQPGEPRPPAFEVHNGVHIHRVPRDLAGPREHLAPDDRLPELLRRRRRSRRCALPRFDAVVTLTTPPIIGLIGTLLRRLKGTRHVYWSMDLHPDASLALGRMSPRNPVVRGLAWLSDFVYRQADKVVVLGPYMADRIALKGVAAERIATIPVWSRRDEIYPIPRDGQPAAQVARAWRTRSSRCTRATSAWPTRSTSSSRRPGGSATAATSSSSSSATGPRLAEVKAAQRARGPDQHPVPRLRPARRSCTSRSRWPTST